MKHWLPSKWQLIVGCLGLATLTHAQQPAAPATSLNQPVQLRPGRRPLGAVLAELARQSHLPFSYSSSLVPLAHRYQVRPGPPRPLGEVLREVLASEHLAYGLLDGQLVMWPDRVAPPPGITLVSRQMAPAHPTTVAAATTSAARVATAVSHSSARQLAAVEINPVVGAARTSNAQRSASRTSLASAAGPSSATSSPTGLLSGSASVLKSGRAKMLTAARSQAATAETAVTQPGSTMLVQANRLQLSHKKKYAAARPTSTPAASRTATTAGQQPGGQPAATYSPVSPLPSRSVALPQLATPAPPATVAATTLPTRSQPDNIPPPPAPRLRGLYLHAEGWVSESLPLGAIGKVGVPRAYLLLGVALADNGRQAGPAFGLGLGTSGRARGRFTPNLDVLAWRLGADHDREDAPILLAQLRPQLSWQVRRGGRLALVAGPTLNLATARHRGPQPPRWDFGRDQWLWANQADNESFLRLWPGVQIGVRF